ncbi:hypothetical protein HNP95_001057 [Methanococcus maripaludis]|uniref:Uncharacterized protein n=1 Tax=Methanococcus maripaludis TaxID=39152 RepID=A0A7J9PTV7_METMI|nr:hypothetical protein [Methanococcus maripaludis]
MFDVCKFCLMVRGGIPLKADPYLNSLHYFKRMLTVILTITGKISANAIKDSINTPPLL